MADQSSETDMMITVGLPHTTKRYLPNHGQALKPANHKPERYFYLHNMMMSSKLLDQPVVSLRDDVI